MISFLSKIGQYILKGAAAFAGFAPILEAVSPQNAGVIQKVDTDLGAMATVVVNIETLAQQLANSNQPMTSAQKLTAATALVGQIVTQSNVVAGRKIADPVLLQKAITEYAQATVDLLQAIHPDEAQNVVTSAIKT